MSWLDKIIPGANKTDGALKRGVPEGLWLKCPSCDAVLTTPMFRRISMSA